MPTKPRVKQNGDRQGAERRPGATSGDVGDDTSEIIETAAHIPDRDQEFRPDPTLPRTERWTGGTEEAEMKGAQDVDEGDTGVVSDPAYNREGNSRVLRAELGDDSLDEHKTPAARAGETEDDESGEELSLEELRERAEALSIPGRAMMTKAQLSAALHGAEQG
jgi:hypothetical protein